MRRVGFVLKNGIEEARAIATELAAWLKSEGHSSQVAAVDVEEEKLAEAIDLCVVLGGDGTLLHAASLVAERNVPILGVNLGHLGFLTSCAPSEAKSAITRALGGELLLEERMRLRCVIRRREGEVITRFACNDAVVSQGALARLIELEARLDGSVIAHYRADGLIVATPTGSTAYTLAAGGPVVHPDVRAMVVTPICPHTLTMRPVVAPSTSQVEVRLAAPAAHVMFTVDGQWGTHLSSEDVVEISQASPPLYLFRPSGSYFDVLKEKLRWG